jgi:hypothetical protein
MLTNLANKLAVWTLPSQFNFSQNFDKSTWGKNMKNAFIATYVQSESYSLLFFNIYLDLITSPHCHPPF